MTITIFAGGFRADRTLVDHSNHVPQVVGRAIDMDPTRFEMAMAKGELDGVPDAPVPAMTPEQGFVQVKQCRHTVAMRSPSPNITLASPLVSSARRRTPPTPSSFDSLPIEINQHIASFLESDQELAAYRKTCRSTLHAIDADNNSFWRRQFLTLFEEPAWKGAGNLKFKKQYQARRRCLRNGAEFTLGDTLAEEKCLEVLRDLIVDSFPEAPSTTNTLARDSLNLVEVRRFVLKHEILQVVFKPRPYLGRGFEYRPTNLLAMIQLLMAPDFLTIPIRQFSFPESQEWVYGTASSHPLFGGCNGLDVNMEGVLHHLNFWKKSIDETLHNAFFALGEHDQPHFWSLQLKAGTMIGRHFKGSYAYVHRDVIPDVRAGQGHNDIIQDSISREGDIDAFQDMRLRFVPEGHEVWPPLFEKHLHAITSLPNRAKTRAQHRSAAPDTALCHKPQNFHFDGEGNDEDDVFNAMGWLNSLPSQLGVPGWQRMTMMKYYTDDAGVMDMGALWAYEGVVLPGGQIMLGRWWAAEDETPEDEVYSGPFILWNVDGPHHTDDDDGDEAMADGEASDGRT